MKRIVLTGIVCIIGAAAAAAQTGYKDFTFGMTVGQVQRITPDAKGYEPRGGTIPGVYALLMYLYHAEIGSLYASTPDIMHAETLYISEQQRLIFAFANNKLYGVEVHELPETVFADLKTKYGDKKTIALNDDNYILVDTAAWNDGQRFIVYCRYSNYTTKEYYRTAVFYYDANYLKPLMKKAIQNFRASRSSRLD